MGWLKKKSAGVDDNGRANPYAQQANASAGGNPYARQDVNAFGSNGPSRAGPADAMTSVDSLPQYSKQDDRPPPQYAAYSAPGSGPALNGARYPSPQQQGLPTGPRAGAANNMYNPAPSKYGVPAASRPPGPPGNAPRGNSALYGGDAQRGAIPANNQASDYRLTGPRQLDVLPAYNPAPLGNAAQRQLADKSASSRSGPGPYGGYGADEKSNAPFGAAPQRATPSPYNPSALDNGEPPSAEDEVERERKEITGQTDHLLQEDVGISQNLSTRMAALVIQAEKTHDNYTNQAVTIHDINLGLAKAGQQIDDSSRGVSTLHKLDKTAFFVPVNDSRKKKAAIEEEKFIQFRRGNREAEEIMASKAALLREHEEFKVKLARSGPKLMAPGGDKFGFRDDDDDFLEDDMTDEEKAKRLGVKHETDDNLDELSYHLGKFNMTMAEMSRKLDKERDEGWIEKAEMKATSNNERAYRVNQKLNQIGK